MAEQRISDATKNADRADAKAEHGAPEVPTAAEAAAAERSAPASEETREHYEDMLDKGANHPGEGRLP